MPNFITRKLNNIVDRLGIAGELIEFFWSQKLWWLIPLIVFLLVMSALLLFAQGAAVTPFIYTFF